MCAAAKTVIEVFFWRDRKAIICVRRTVKRAVSAIVSSGLSKCNMCADDLKDVDLFKQGLNVFLRDHLNNSIVLNRRINIGSSEVRTHMLVDMGKKFGDAERPPSSH